MNKIKILSTEEAQKIAAGEVVERPASVVKELIENSIDAEASQITIYIEKAGKDLIRIIDNGCGMSPKDASMCFLPHATSKINNVEELFYINSFGFRGEALGSISSISKASLTTRQKINPLAIKLDYVGKTFSNKEEISANVGTNIVIKDLFYNVPARKKFLKQDETEWNKISSLIDAFCLNNMNIHFRLYRDDKLILNAPSVTDLKSRVSQVFGHNLSEQLISIKEESKGDIKLNGLISNHQFWRYNKNLILFFVNNRLVKNPKLTRSLIKGYLNVLPPDKFPAGVIFIEVDKSTVDVNVHPRKEEVLFSKPLMVENKIKKTIKETLENHISNQISTPKEQGELENFNFDSQPFNQYSTSLESNNTHSIPQFYNTPFEEKLTHNVSASNNSNIVATTEQPEEEQLATHQENIKIVGQILQTYILIEQENSLIIIDQHAAHERILYEKFATKFEGLDGTRLLFPEILHLENKHINSIIKVQSLFESLGIQFEIFGDNELAIKSSPPKIQNQSLKELFLETAHLIEEHETLDEIELKKKITEHIHSHMACKAAIKAGDILSIQEMKDLIMQLNKTEKRFICIHGRPTMWIISQNELERKFKRKL
ncbi:DNA mismatch repair endonuclease MutL [Candidatus Babeliales bacterium]|nr:DNA mismatch repair endonuclease MutL [Candidatus Babeliales bacterium]